MSLSLKITSLIINFSLSFFCCTSFFSIKVIFYQIVTLSVKKGLTALQNCLLPVISVVLILPKNFCFSFLIRVTQQLRCLLHAFLSVSPLVFTNLSLRRECVIIFLVIVLLRKGGWFAQTYLFFRGTFFLGVTSTVFLKFVKKTVSPTKAELKKSLIKLHLKVSYNFDIEYMVFVLCRKLSIQLSTFCENQITLFQLSVIFEKILAYLLLSGQCTLGFLGSDNRFYSYCYLCYYRLGGNLSCVFQLVQH